MFNIRNLFCSFGVLSGLTLGLPMFAQEANEEAIAPLAKIGQVEAAQSDLKREFFGHVVAKETVDMTFQVGGQIVELPVIEGAPIGEGEVLAQLDLEPFEIALSQATANHTQAARTLDRLRKLEGSSVSPSTVEDAQTQMELANIALRDAERSLKLATLTSPFEALVATRYVPNFSTIGAGAPVVRVHDMSELRMKISVPEILFQSAGDEDDVTLTAKFPAIDEEFPVEPVEFVAETSAVGQTFEITLGMEPPETGNILPGSSVTITAIINQETSYPMIPSSALVTKNDGSAQVMIFEPAGADEGQVSLRDVEITSNNDGEILVLSGLNADEEFIYSGANQLVDGDRVRRFKGFSK